MMEDTGHILVVDDYPMNRMKLSRFLQQKGHTVTLAEHGKQAVELIDEQSFDLMLLDIEMPEMDGYEVLEYLKSRDMLRNLPVIVISASDEMENVIKCIQMGAEDHLPKPFDPILLNARIGSSLEKKRLRDHEVEYLKQVAQLMEKELEIGRRIQKNFFPDTVKQPPGWEIAYRFKTAKQVSGDFYDVFTLDKNAGVVVVIADVCDKGVGAALFMGLFRSLIRAFADFYYGDSWTQAFINNEEADHPVCNSLSDAGKDKNHVRGLEIVTSMTNNYIACTHSRSNMFATIFLGVIDVDADMMFYVNAGHEAPVLVGENGIKHVLETSGPAVGLMPDMDFVVKELAFEPDDILVAFTDGITEARSVDGSLYGDNTLFELIKEPAASADDMLHRIESSVFSHAEGAVQSDDITLLAVRRTRANDKGE